MIASRVHKWLALIIGFQLILWFASGALMSFLSIDKVRGEHLVDRQIVATIPQGTVIADASDMLGKASGKVQSLSVHMLLGRPVAEILTDKGIQLFDASTGRPLPNIDASQAQLIAANAWVGGALPASTVALVTAETTEYRGALPAWRVGFADVDHTRVFVTDSGKIAAVRTGTWRLYDFFWGLHIMDWSNHENFNTWWLLAFAIGGLTLALAGTVLLALRWPFRRLRTRPPGA